MWLNWNWGLKEKKCMIWQIVFPYKWDLCGQHQVALKAEMRQSIALWLNQYWKTLAMSHRLSLQVVPLSGCEWFVHMAPQGLLYPQLHVSGPQATFSSLLHLYLVFEGHTWASSPPTFSQHSSWVEESRNFLVSRILAFRGPREAS